MAEETIVAVYDTAAHADAAVRDLEAAKVPSNAISRQASTTSGTTTTTAQPVREKGFWSSLFGGEPDHSTDVYDRSVDSGSHVVTVRVPDEHVANVTSILERHNPIDIDERAASYGLAGTSTTTRETMATPVAGQATRGAALQGGEERLQLAEEQLTVGKRLLNRGTTRIRRFVVETPVEENVTLHSEQVSVERRPVSGDARVTPANFTDKTLEVTETEEEAVVGKSARVKEEVVVRKDAADRVETIHDTVRREDVEITKDAAVETGTTTTSGTTTSGTTRTSGTVPPVNR